MGAHPSYSADSESAIVVPFLSLCSLNFAPIYFQKASRRATLVELDHVPKIWFHFIIDVANVYKSKRFDWLFLVLARRALQADFDFFSWLVEKK